MSEGLQLILNDDGVLEEYDDTYDLTIHCESKEEQEEVLNKLNRQWIPVSERLPEDLEEVNVTWVNHDPEPHYNFVKDKPFTATAVYYKGKWYWYSSACVDVLAEYGKNEIDEIDGDIEVTAWMPLPEPLKEEKAK